MLIRLYLCVLFGFAASFALTADFIIVESPQSVTLYNQFEQPLSKQEIAEFLPYSPLRVIRTDGRLGDQITRAMQCSIGQKTYYLLLDDQGVILGDKNRIHVLKGCTLLDDTVSVSRPEAVTFSHFAVNAESAEKLSKGTELIVLFRWKNSFYALQTGLLPRFGWIPVSGREAWKRVSQSVALDTAMTDQTLDQLAQRIEWANKQYAIFFGKFSQSTGNLKTAPQWQRAAGRLTWRLSPPYGNTGELDASTKLLVEDLRDMLIGKPFSVNFNKGELSIAAKAFP
jgi:hypothetical protein